MGDKVKNDSHREACCQRWKELKEPQKSWEKERSGTCCIDKSPPAKDPSPKDPSDGKKSSIDFRIEQPIPGIFRYGSERFAKKTGLG